MNASVPPVLRFSGFTLDLARVVSRVPVTRLLTPAKELWPALLLVQNPGRLVPKDELIAAVWPDVAVTDDSLTKCVSEIRSGLNDTGQRIIKTVPRRGYIFDVAVSRDLGVIGIAQPAAEVDRTGPLVAGDGCLAPDCAETCWAPSRQCYWLWSHRR